MHRQSVTLAALLGAAGLCIAAGFGSIASAQTANTPQALSDAAYKAMGMTDVKLAPAEIVTLVTKGSMQVWDPGESESVADPTKPDWGTSTFTQTWDRSRGFYRTEWVRPRANGGMRNYTDIITDEYDPSRGGYVMGIDVNGGQPNRAINGNSTMPMHTMSGLRLAATLRELERNNVVDEMHDNPDRVSALPNQRAGGKTYPAAQYRGDYGTFIVMFDPATHFPAVVRTRDFDVHAGDSDFDETLSDWRDIGQGLKMPFRQVYTLNGVKIFDTTLSGVTLNPQLPADAFTVPTALRGKAPKAAAPDKVPFQWVLRRMGNGFYLDSDALYTDDGGMLRLMDVAPNVSLVTGGSHNTLIVATNTYLVAFEAPGDDGLSKIAIDLAKQKYPGKPIRYLVLTHHHIDHTGGLRSYAAEGATIVVGKGDGAFFRKVLAAPHQLDPYPLKAFTPKVIEVDGKWSVNDGGREIDAFSLDNPHATGYLIPYIPDAKLGFVTDLWNPGPPVMNANPNLVALVRGVEKMGIQPERFAGGHGAVGNYADVVQAVQKGGSQ